MITGDKCYLDYQITDNYSKVSFNGNATCISAAYNYIDTTVWIKEQWLCDLIQEKLERKFYPGVIFHIEKNESIDLRNFLTSISKDKHLIGTYGDHFE